MEMQIQQIKMSEIHMDEEFNSRGVIAPIDVADLVRDIEKRGLIMPVTVAPYPPEMVAKTGKKYRLVAGYRRSTSCRVLGWTSIPAIIRADMVDEAEARLFNLSENVQRKELNILQEAVALAKLKALGVSRQDVAEKLGMSQGWVQMRFMLLDLPVEVQREVAAGLFTHAQIRELYTVFNQEGKESCFEAARLLKEAKSRGRKITVDPNKKKPSSKRHRTRSEIFEMMAMIQTSLGNGLFTRCLAWAAGEISDADLYGDLKERATRDNKVFTPPEGVVI